MSLVRYRSDNVQRSGPVQKLVKTLLELLDLEPVGVEGHHVRSSVLIVRPAEVLLQPLEDLRSIVAVQYALVQIGTVSTFVALDVVSVQWNFPDSWIKKKHVYDSRFFRTCTVILKRKKSLPGKDLVGQVPALHSWGIL